MADAPPPWSGPSTDPNDEQFGDVIESTSVEKAGAFPAVLLGEPYDGAVIGRRGAASGPAAIRESLAGVKTHQLDSGPVGPIGDLGDAPLPGPGEDVRVVQEKLEETTERVHAADTIPVFLGGDNSLTVPNAAPLLEEDLGILSLDAHLDCREVRDTPTSGTPYRQLHARGLKTLVVCGARHFETSSAYHTYLDDQGGTVLPAERVGDDPTRAATRALDALDDVDTLYLSLDVDVLDGTHAPGVSAPTPGGLTPRELFRIIGEVAGDDRLAGVEVVECAPPLDAKGRTAATAARAIAHALGGIGA
jgi:formimidoylglutamase